MQLARVRKAIEAGELDPAAKEIALLIAQGEDEVIRFFLGYFLRWYGEKMSEEELADYRLQAETYLRVCNLLGLGEEWKSVGQMHLRFVDGYLEDDA